MVLNLKAKVELTQQDVLQLFEYKDGDLYWKSDRARGKIKKNSKAGSLSTKGYHRLMIGYKEIPTHRVIFLYHKGYFPKVVDHIDGNTLNNKIENLREATVQTNQYNRKKGINNTSGCKNVSWNKKQNSWQVHIKQSKKVFSWYEKDFEFAELIAYEAREILHGKFANHV